MLNGGAPSDKPLIGDGNQRDPVLKKKWQIRDCLSLGLPHENMAGYMFFPVNPWYSTEKQKQRLIAEYQGVSPKKMQSAFELPNPKQGIYDSGPGIDQQGFRAENLA